LLGIRHIVVSAAAVAILGVPTSHSHAAVDVETEVNANVRGTLLPEGEVEELRFEAIAGTLLSFKLTAKKKSDLDLEVTLFDTSGDPIDLPSFPGFRDQGKRLSLKKLELPDTGRYRLEITGTGTGEYALKLKGQPAKRFEELLELGRGRTRRVEFAALPGATIKLKVKTEGESTAEPRFGDLGDFVLDELGKISPTSHAVTLTNLTEGGDLSVEVINMSGTGSGNVVVRINVKSPAVTRDKHDFRGRTLGEPDGGETVRSRTIDASDGGTIGINDSESAIDDTRLTIPEDALAADTRIMVSSAPQPTPPQAEANQPAGPAVAFTPAGTTFPSAVSITVPYDPSEVPMGLDPTTHLRVMSVGRKGRSTTLVPASVDTGRRLVTVETTQLGTLMTVAPKGTPNLAGREYWATRFEVEIVPDDEGNDSRVREIAVTTGTASFGGEGRYGGVQLEGQEIHYTVDHDDLATGTAPRTASSVSDSGRWTYRPEGQRIEIDEGGGNSSIHSVGRDGRVLVSCEDDDQSLPIVQLDLFLQKPRRPLTAASVAGKYWVGDFEVAPSAAGGIPARLAFFRAFGMLTLRASGAFVLQRTVHSGELNGTTGAFDAHRKRHRETGRFTIDTSDELTGSLVLRFRVNRSAVKETRLFPGRDGTIMMAAGPSNGGAIFQVAVRTGTRLGRRDLQGTYARCALGLASSSYEIGAPTPGRRTTPVPDLLGDNWIDTVVFNGKAGMFSTPEERDHLVMRDERIRDGVLVANFIADPFDLRYRLAGNGLFKYKPDKDTPMIGAIAREATYGFVMDDPKGNAAVYGLGFFLKLPPERPSEDELP
jgi:hypothetical protein